MTLEIQQRQSLVHLNTLGLDVTAERLAIARSEADVIEALALARSRGWPLTILGGGSNVVFTGDVKGLVLIVGIPGVLLEGERVTAGAGEGWHALVLATLEHELSGLENLALIPGSVGAAPIQNIGAYGVELESVFESLTAIERSSGSRVTLSRADCEFGYRDSLFKNRGRDEFVITSVSLSLSSTFTPHLAYADLKNAFEGQAPASPLAVAEKVCEIRRQKLPDPDVVGNVGSFFKNPAVSGSAAAALLADYPQLSGWTQADGSMKLSAAWLIDQCGFRGRGRGGAAIFDRHALVIINRESATPDDVIGLAREIAEEVQARFGVALDIEPRLI